jgi:hypothetical protein
MALLETDVPGLMRDTDSGAVLNVDGRRLAAYRLQKEAARRTARDSDRLTKLEGDVDEIKDMLRAILEGIRQ